MTPRTIPSVLYKTRRKNPLVHKGLKEWVNLHLKSRWFKTFSNTSCTPLCHHVQVSMFEGRAIAILLMLAPFNCKHLFLSFIHVAGLEKSSNHIGSDHRPKITNFQSNISKKCTTTPLYSIHFKNIMSFYGIVVVLNDEDIEFIKFDAMPCAKLFFL